MTYLASLRGPDRGSRRWSPSRPFLLGSLLGLGAVACTPMPGGGASSVIVPADYRDTFRVVRECRTSIEHGATIRVYVNEIGADGYLNDVDPLPEGTIVVKEEFKGATCDNDAELEFLSAMLKREPGFDAEDNDWQWQEIAAKERMVTLDDKATCISCHRAKECVARDYMCTVP